MKRKMALVMSLLLILGVMTACGGGAEPTATPAANNSATETPTSAQQESNTGDNAAVEPQVEIGNTEESPTEASVQEINWDEHSTYTWWMYSTPSTSDYYTSYSDNPVVKFLENKYNVTFIFEQPVSGTEADALSLMMGTGQYTDIMDLSTYTGSQQELLDDGIIIDIADYLDYMPYFKNMLETIPEMARASYDDNGRILSFPSYADDIVNPWSGLVYRRDILDTMTGGNIQFPSGNDEPTTLEDWEYMLPLFKQYFEAAGMVEYAPLIIPASGYFHYGELMSTFGAYYSFYQRDDIIHAGILEEPMYNYVAKMAEWYEAGYIYKDFASRVQDMFFLPNTALTYGGAAGAWYGMQGNLGDVMSMPEYGLIFDVHAATSPMSDGITYKDMMARHTSLYGGAGFGNAINAKCENIEKLLSIIDFMYTPEGGMLRTYGLTKEQIPEGYDIMERMGMADGAYSFDASGNFVFNPNLDEVGGTIGRDAVNGIRFPGFERISYANQAASDDAKAAWSAWGAQDAESEFRPLPDQLSFTTEESTTISENNVRMTDYMNEMIAKFIMGSESLNEDTWATFTNQLISYGVEENQAIYQAAYDRFMARGK
jgi:putative aldouronate transport system substrate-binding protein